MAIDFSHIKITYSCTPTRCVCVCVLCVCVCVCVWCVFVCCVCVCVCVCVALPTFNGWCQRIHAANTNNRGLVPGQLESGLVPKPGLPS